MLGHLWTRCPGMTGISQSRRWFSLIISQHPAPIVQEAIEQALSYGCVHLDGVLHCLHQLATPEVVPPPTDTTEQPPFPEVGNQPIDLSRYELLLKQRW